jgi:tRNA/tmRNA/rRNA uracil-C5-methylase (TrmA/RlmC/RlmD family)
VDVLVGPVDIGAVAHGGHCVARYEGRVIFARHCLPGERVMLRLTDTSQDRFWRADAVEILQPSPDRVDPPCAVAGPGLCGGCDFQHVQLTAQRRLKTEVVAEQLSRMAKIEWRGEVEPVTSAAFRDGLGWRKRMRYHVDEHGLAGLRAHRSHEIIPLPPGGCPIAAVDTPSVVDQRWPPGAELLAATATSGQALYVDQRLHLGSAELVERAAGRDWAVAADGFWQVHPAAADTLVGAVLAGLGPQRRETALDLFCGVGLFAGALADHGCEVWGVDSSRVAVAAGRRNLEDVADRVHLSTGRVDRRLDALPGRADLIVLDPPRAGAGRAVMAAVAGRRPRAMAYVACDPAALARDLASAAGLGYQAVSIRAFDLFPMTHHIECVAILERRVRPEEPARRHG